MRPTTALNDNVFDFQALLHPGHRLRASQGRGSASGPDPCREARDPRFLGLGRFGDRFVSGASGSSKDSKAPVSIDAILEALCELDGSPRNPPGGKPQRRFSTARVLAA